MKSEKKIRVQMGFEPTTLRDLGGRYNHWATGDSMLSKGEMWVLDGTAPRGHTNNDLANINS